MKKNILQTDSKYGSLRKRVEETLLLGRRNIEKAKVMTYMRTGKIIDSYLSRYGNRAEHYGSQIVTSLAEDLDLSPSLLWQLCVEFCYVKSFRERKD